MSGADLSLTAEPYGTPARLQARIALHASGAGTHEDFHHWLWRHVAAPAEADVLEVGVGSARLWATLASRVPAGWRLTLSDRSAGMVDEARSVLAALAGPERRAPFGNARFLVADVADLPFPAARFDLAFANHMLYHVPDLAGAVAELRRVLRPGGTLVAATNGEAHLAEIAALLQELADAWPDVRVDRPNRLTFTLESGAETLGAAFDHVVLHDRSDVLHVTDATVLGRYLLSMAYAPDAAVAADLEAWVEARVARALRDGPFAVRRDTGVFVAR